MHCIINFDVCSSVPEQLTLEAPASSATLTEDGCTSDVPPNRYTQLVGELCYACMLASLIVCIYCFGTFYLYLMRLVAVFPQS